MVLIPIDNIQNIFEFGQGLLLGLKNGHIWAELHLCSTERQETARSPVFYNE
jgi:hypothetical protein